MSVYIFFFLAELRNIRLADIIKGHNLFDLINVFTQQSL